MLPKILGAPSLHLPLQLPSVLAAGDLILRERDLVLSKLVQKAVQPFRQRDLRAVAPEPPLARVPPHEPEVRPKDGHGPALSTPKIYLNPSAFCWPSAAGTHPESDTKIKCKGGKKGV